MLAQDKFNAQKAVEAMLYISAKIKNPTLHSISKVLYFADKKHLECYGRFIAGDEYIAMKHGPVPSASYDILKSARGDGVRHRTIAQTAFSVTETHKVKPQRQAQLHVLSESEQESLDYAILHYGNLSFKKLTDLSHDAAWHAADDNDLISIESIAATLPEHDALLRHLQDPYPG